MDLSWVDDEIYSMENLLLGFGYHRRQIFYFQERLGRAIVAFGRGSFGRLNGDACDGESRRTAAVETEMEMARGGRRGEVETAGGRKRK